MSERHDKRLQVTTASISDVPSIHEFILEAWRQAGPSALGWTGATETSIQELASPEYLRQLISNPKVRILLARDGERVVGFAANRKTDDTTLELAGIIVDERFTGKGIGTALIGAAMEAASAEGYGDVIVKTETFNDRAIGFYEANCFSREGFSKEEVEGKSIDLVVLRRRLRAATALR